MHVKSRAQGLIGESDAALRTVPGADNLRNLLSQMTVFNETVYGLNQRVQDLNAALFGHGPTPEGVGRPDARLEEVRDIGVIGEINLQTELLSRRLNELSDRLISFEKSL